MSSMRLRGTRKQLVVEDAQHMLPEGHLFAVRQCLVCICLGKAIDWKDGSASNGRCYFSNRYLALNLLTEIKKLFTIKLFIILFLFVCNS
jgi:hypothetical protein